MAFPSISASTEGSQTTDSNRLVATYPSVTAGDLLLFIGATDGNPTFVVGDLANSGVKYPGTTASLANAGTSENAEAWVNPGNIVSDNGVEASITAATYDSPDISQLLVASNFGFSIPSNAIVTGIIVEIDRRDGGIGAASDNRVQLAKGTTFASLVGNNKADLPTDWPTASAIATYGSNSDLWGATWTPSEINASSFAVMLSVQADAANTDIFVDFIRITVHYVQNDWTIQSSAQAPGNVAQSIFAKKIATGSETGNLGIGLSAAEEAAWKVLAISNWEGTLGSNFTNSDANGGSVPFGGHQTGTSTTPDALSMDPFNWSAEDTLWINCMVADGGDTTSSGVPTNYTRLGTALNTGGATGVSIDVSTRQLNASSEDPSSSTISTSIAWVAFILAVRPLSGFNPVFMRRRTSYKQTVSRRAYR